MLYIIYMYIFIYSKLFHFTLHIQSGVWVVDVVAVNVVVVRVLVVLGDTKGLSLYTNVAQSVSFSFRQLLDFKMKSI